MKFATGVETDLLISGIRERCQFDNPLQVIRCALAVYETLTKECVEGRGVVLIKSPEGEREVQVIPEAKVIKGDFR